MPNHLHDIIHILEKSLRAIGPIAPTKPTIKPNSLGSILGQFKSVTTKKIQRAGASNFKWQRNYWERVIRDETDLPREILKKRSTKIE